jgi:DNA-binding response OmpR family regulator
MKILVVSEEDRSISGLILFLGKHNLASERMKWRDFQEFSNLQIFEGEFSAIIFDRVLPSLNTLISLNGKSDCFFIVDDFEKIKLFGEGLDGFVLRFYFVPLNYQLLIDDIKSITAVKQYLVLGVIELGGVNLDLNRRSLINDEKEVSLKNKEFELLLYLSKNRGKVLSRINILENVWDINSIISTNTVDVHVSKLRKTLKDNFSLERLIRTIPCSGYILG